MAKKRMIDTKFWSDSFVVELNLLDRYLFLYLLTNEHTNICGVYELPLKVIANETGIEKEMLAKMFKRLEGKIWFLEDWVYIKNFSKNQTSNPSVRKGAEISLGLVPEKILNKIKEIDRLYTDSPQPASYINININSNINSNLKIKSFEKDIHFQKFWDSYPKKEQKKKALAVWKRASLDSLVDEITDFVEKAKRSDRWKKGYIKQPQAFLNGECWKDDLESYGGVNKNDVYKNNNSESIVEKLKAKQLK